MNWQEILEKFPEANFLQSPNYARMNEILRARTIAEYFDDGGYALMIVRNAKRGRYLEIPCGPLIDWDDKKLVKKVLARIGEIAKKEQCVFVRMRPQILGVSKIHKLMDELGLK